MILLSERAPAALANFSCLRRNRPLQDGQRLRDRGKLRGTHRRALVPLFRLELALRCQVLQVRAVVVQHRISARHVDRTYLKDLTTKSFKYVRSSFSTELVLVMSAC